MKKYTVASHFLPPQEHVQLLGWGLFWKLKDSDVWEGA
jgi:hypothetical protein